MQAEQRTIGRAQREGKAAATAARTAALCATASVVLGLISAWGCDAARQAHPFLASRYDASTGCVGPVEIHDVIDGADPGQCKQMVCWVNQRGNAFVSWTMCDGPPDWVRVEAAPVGSLCEQALAAAQQWGAGKCMPEAGADGPAQQGDEGGLGEAGDEG